MRSKKNEGHVGRIQHPLVVTCTHTIVACCRSDSIRADGESLDFIFDFFFRQNANQPVPR